MPRPPRRNVIAWLLLVAAGAAPPARAAAAADAAPPATRSTFIHNFDDAVARHPAGATLARLFPAPAPALPPEFAPTGLTKQDYLKLVAGNVDFWKRHQNPAGAIIDPYEKDPADPGQGLEKQYSTPAFALSCATLIKEAGRDDLLDAAVRAFSFALSALQNKTTANAHPDFYIPMLVHAHRALRTRVPADVAAKWEGQFKALVPQQVYKDTRGGGNWNLVNVAGEALRRKDDLVAPEQLAAQQKYLDAMLAAQQKHFSRYGMYLDPNVPLAYDAFPRLWLEDMLADGAYPDGAERGAVEQFVMLGGLSSLLLVSPSGEWPSGGRSAHHQWNEAQSAVIGEANAARWKRLGRDDLAGAFKRMARMSVESIFRWQRPSGELWIVKNYAEPAGRFGFEGYSFNSQYNLLAAAMLCIAHARADESIPERPMPSEHATYVYDISDPFTKVVAASGGYYVLVDIAADGHYNGTGLQRVHRRGVALSPLSDSAAPDRWFAGAKGDPKIGLAPGIQWKDGDAWIGLADFQREKAAPKTSATAPPPAPARPQRVVKRAEVIIDPSSDLGAVFMIRYDLEGPGARDVAERYEITADGVQCTQRFADDAGPVETARFAFPLLVNDGARDTRVSLDPPGRLNVGGSGGELTLQILPPPELKFTLDGPRIPTHNGHVQAAVGTLDDPVTGIGWIVTLRPAPIAK